MNINEVIHGFKVESITEEKEVKATAYRFVHVGTNAQLLWLKREDDNKTFSIAFKTTPTDDTGVFHILEHSVLNGSQRFPLKEPFVDLIKGSLNTFLNAMTFPDKTVYPISSRNNQDFKNLMRVYLDAVFAPLCVKKDNVFRQEGWHYELNNVDEQPLVKGVVYNEMKGAYSSSERLASQMVTHYLFPDNCYSFSSGGDPKYIPTLTYEKFCEQYAKYYNASNSRIFLDGDLNIEETLQIINDEYLSKMSPIDEKVVIEKQKPVDVGLVRNVFESNTLEDKALINYAYVIGDYAEVEKITALQLIASVLADNNQSILCKAILDSGLAQDINVSVEDSILQPYFEIAVSNTNEKSYDEVTKIVYDTINKVCADGLDKEELKALLSKMEFAAKERDFGSLPKGLVFNMAVLVPWLHDDDPLSALKLEHLYRSLQEKIDTTYYEDLLKEVVLDSKHKVTVLSIPSLTLEAEKLETMNQKMKKLKESMTSEQLVDLVNWNKEFSDWQQSVDTLEQKATLPKLELSDINEKPANIDYQISEYDGIKILEYADNTDGINYNSLYFNIADLTSEELKDLSLFVSLVGNLNTSKHTLSELSKLRKKYIGTLEFSPSLVANANSDKYATNLLVHYSCLNQYNKQALDIVVEMLYELSFVDKTEIVNVINQVKNEIEMAAIYSGHQFAISRVQAMSSEASACDEYIRGYEYYKHVKAIIDENSVDQFVERLKKLYEKLFTTNRLTVSVMGENKRLIGESIIDRIKKADGEIVRNTRPLIKADKEGIKIASQVSYAVEGYKPNIDIRENSGKLAVVGRILSLDYLWNAVRAMGGAYGTGFSCRTTNYIYHSYRDPNPSNALSAYDGSSEYLKSFVESDADITPYIIGAIGDSDPLLTPKTKMVLGDLQFFAESTYERRCKKWSQILNMTKLQVLELIPSFEIEDEKKNICVVGPNDVLQNLECIKTIHEF